MTSTSALASTLAGHPSTCGPTFSVQDMLEKTAKEYVATARQYLTVTGYRFCAQDLTNVLQPWDNQMSRNWRKSREVTDSPGLLDGELTRLIGPHVSEKMAALAKERSALLRRVAGQKESTSVMAKLHALKNIPVRAMRLDEGIPRAVIDLLEGEPITPTIDAYREGLALYADNRGQEMLRVAEKEKLGEQPIYRRVKDEVAAMLAAADEDNKPAEAQGIFAVSIALSGKLGGLRVIFGGLAECERQGVKEITLDAAAAHGQPQAVHDFLGYLGVPGGKPKSGRLLPFIQSVATEKTLFDQVEIADRIAPELKGEIRAARNANRARMNALVKDQLDPTDPHDALIARHLSRPWNGWRQDPVAGFWQDEGKANREEAVRKRLEKVAGQPLFCALA